VIHGKTRVVQVVDGAKVASTTVEVEEIGAVTTSVVATSRIMVVVLLEGISEAVVEAGQVHIQVYFFNSPPPLPLQNLVTMFVLLGVYVCSV
jgi:hypothetical protein